MVKTSSKGLLIDSYDYFKKRSIIEFILYIVGGMLTLSLFINLINPTKEGFGVQKKMVLKSGGEIYDDFYANQYDVILYNKKRNRFEVGVIRKQTDVTEESIILDVGSGIGHHVDEFSNENIKAIGIDNSLSMVNKAKITYPNNDYRNLDATDETSFSKDTFTHITCFNFTVYYMQNKDLFFKNCYSWLKPGGYIVINLVDSKGFDPVLTSSNPFEVSSSKYVKKCNHNNTTVKLVDYDYKSNFEIYPNDSTAVFREQFKEVTSGNIRKHELRLFMPTQKEVVNIAKHVGFILLGKVDMSTCTNDSQYLYIFQKPT